jgi:hypothetical protein
MYFWYQMWISDLFRILLLSVYFMLLFRKFHIYVIMGRKWGRRNRAASIGMVLTALGFQLLLAGLAINLFGLEESLSALNNEMLVLPGGLSKILGITTHLGIPLGIPVWLIWFSGGLILLSLLLYLINRKPRI